MNGLRHCEERFSLALALPLGQVCDEAIALPRGDCFAPFSRSQ